MRVSIFHILIFSLCTLGACNVKQFIPEGKHLYDGPELKVEKEENVRKWNEIENELNALFRPNPNSKFLGQRIGLWAHFKGSQEKPGFINRFLKNRFGEEPVYLSDVNIPQTEELLVNRLENRGFFYSTVSSEVDYRSYTAKVHYQAEVPVPYKMKNFEYDHDSLMIDRVIRELLDKTELKEGDRFDLNQLRAERERLDQALKRRGFYNFNPDFLVFEADTNHYDDKSFDLFLRLKQSAPEKGILPYRIQDITVYPNFALEGYEEGADTTTVKGIDFVQREKVFKPHLLEPYILLEEGDLFDSDRSRLTSNRLSGIGNYRYVNIRYREREELNEDGEGVIDSHIYLSPLNKRALRAEIQGVSKSNNFAGPALLLSYRNRNLFHGGEILSLTGKFAYEAQIASGEREGLTSFELGLKGDLIFPRVVFPIPIRERFAYSVPKTKISLGTEFQDRRGLYRLNSVSSSYGYFWNANRFVYHEINPISLNFVNLSRTTPEFDEILDRNPFLRLSFEQQFIAGITYSFAYNQLMDKFRTHSIYFGANLDIAGAGLNLANELVNSQNPNRFLGFDYAQYNKGDLDFRYYIRFTESNLLVSRIFGGLGLPYGNSVSLPFVKQYFSGGPNSVRAFRIRSLGPGSYIPDQANVAGFFDQAGDIRIEANVEYRFPITSFLKGAVFADAGNVWLVNENEALPGGQFSSDWMQELGVGVGAGLRVDVDFFVIRFDLATPVRRPHLPEGERWEKSFRIGEGDWRRENLVFNFAIGYPF